MNDKKQTFLHGAALLALATAVVKIIGAFYKIMKRHSRITVDNIYHRLNAPHFAHICHNKIWFF